KRRTRIGVSFGMFRFSSSPSISCERGFIDLVVGDVPSVSQPASSSDAAHAADAIRARTERRRNVNLATPPTNVPLQVPLYGDPERVPLRASPVVVPLDDRYP